MNATCPQCSMTIPFDDTRLPHEPFNTMCPRCRESFTVTPHRAEEPHLGPPAGGGAQPASQGPADLLRVLGEILAGSARQGQQQKAEIDKWERRRILLCVDDAITRDRLRGAFDPSRYEVFCANLSSEALEIIHEYRVEVIVLSPNFDPDRQGGATMMQYVNRMTPQVRRRSYVVLMSPQLRTLDTYLAYANGVNLTVHPEDSDSFQAIFERSLRDFNDLYRPFNQASEIEPL